MKDTANNNHNGYFFADSQGRIAHANETLRQWCQYGYAALEGSPLHHLFCGNDDEIKRVLDNLKSHNQEDDFKTHLSRKKGTPLEVLLSMRQVRDDQGNFCGYEAHIKRPSAKSSAKKSGKSLAKLLDSNPSPMIRVNSDGLVLYANPASHILLATLDAEVGKPISRGWKNWVAQVISLNTIMTIDVACLGIDYDCKFVPQGSEVLIYGVDITDRKMHEENLELAYDTVSQQLKEQELTLKAEQQVRHVSEQALLEAKIIKKTTYPNSHTSHLVIRELVHDVKNMLGVIIGNVGLVEGDLHNATATFRRLARISHAAQLANQHCESLLSDQAKRPTNMVEQQHHPVSLKSTLKHAEDLLGDVTGLEKVNISFVHSQADLPTQASAQIVQRVVMNLVLNGIESMQGSHGQVNIHADIMEVNQSYINQCHGFSQAKAGCYAYVEVEDNGCGMSEHTLQHLFEPYYTTKAQGHGLGMVSILQSVQDNHGLIHVESHAAEGSIIRVLFPLLSPTDPIGHKIHTLLHGIAAKNNARADAFS